MRSEERRVRREERGEERTALQQENKMATFVSGRAHVHQVAGRPAWLAVGRANGP